MGPPPKMRHAQKDLKMSPLSRGESRTLKERFNPPTMAMGRFCGCYMGRLKKKEEAEQIDKCLPVV